MRRIKYPSLSLVTARIYSANVSESRGGGVEAARNNRFSQNGYVT